MIMHEYGHWLLITIEQTTLLFLVFNKRTLNNPGSHESPSEQCSILHDLRGHLTRSPFYHINYVFKILYNRP